MTVQDDLGASADLIEQFGWWHNLASGSTGRFCVMTALSFVAGHGPHNAERFEAAMIEVAQRIGADTSLVDPLVVVPDWNDDPGRTLEDVMRALRG